MLTLLHHIPDPAAIRNDRQTAFVRQRAGRDADETHVVAIPNTTAETISPPFWIAVTSAAIPARLKKPASSA